MTARTSNELRNRGVDLDRSELASSAEFAALGHIISIERSKSPESTCVIPHIWLLNFRIPLTRHCGNKTSNALASDRNYKTDVTSFGSMKHAYNMRSSVVAVSELSVESINIFRLLPAQTRALLPSGEVSWHSQVYLMHGSHVYICGAACGTAVTMKKPI